MLAPCSDQENVELEPVWPDNLIGDTGNQSDLAKRTFTNRSNVTGSAPRHLPRHCRSPRSVAAPGDHAEN